jgi:acylphosphatase
MKAPFGVSTDSAQTGPSGKYKSRMPGLRLVLSLPAYGCLLPAMPEVHHAKVYFTGHVQGVGFRYQTMQVAREYEVSGWVENLDDGRVLLETEGTVDEVRDFVASIQERMGGLIRKTEVSESRREAQFQGFGIR